MREDPQVASGLTDVDTLPPVLVVNEVAVAIVITHCLNIGEGRAGSSSAKSLPRVDDRRVRYAMVLTCYLNHLSGYWNVRPHSTCGTVPRAGRSARKGNFVKATKKLLAAAVLAAGLTMSACAPTADPGAGATCDSGTS